MDPMDYMLPNNHNRPSGQYDPVHSSSNHWSSHPQSQNNPPYPWPTQNPSLPQLYSHHYGLPPGANSIPDSYSHHASMLPPMLGLSSSSAFSGGMPGPMPPRPNGRNQPYRNGMPVPASPITSGTGNHSHHDTAFANQIPPNRSDFQAPMFNLGMPPLGPSQEVNSLHRSAYSHDSGANSMSHSNNNNYFSHFAQAPLPPQPYNPTSSRRGHMSAASITPRPFGNIPSPTRPSPPSSGFRRSYPRQRRSASRMMATEIGREDDEDEGYQGSSEHALHSPGSSESPPEMEDTFVRQMQLVRGSVSTKMVASKLTVRSLQIVKLEELSDADRCCVICYNEYGIEAPEGIKEVPLRLPKCGHIFGDHCIKKWFEDSDSCPYCRDKLHAVPKTQSGSSARAYMDLMRLRGIHIPPGTSSAIAADEALNRAVLDSYLTTERQNISPTRHSGSTGRRSPPGEGNEHQHRRIRARHRITAVDAARQSETRNRSVSFETASQTAVTGSGLPSMQEQPAQLSTGRHVQEWMGDSAQAANEPSTIVQDHSEETQFRPGAAALRSPVLPTYPVEAVEGQHPRVRSLRSSLPAQTSASFEESMESADTSPDFTYRENRH
ncbi:hypothetical protein DER45DRAFT_537047 [Fusarium avenaceum]|nr:hypothetical protein DER45DRAFT_537047 [Fusarium avenaceum]